MTYTLPRCYCLATICSPLLRKYCVLLKDETKASIQLQMDAARSPRQELNSQLVKTKVRDFYLVVNKRNRLIDPTNDKFLRRKVLLNLL